MTAPVPTYPEYGLPLGGSLVLRGVAAMEGGARYEHMNLVFRGSTGQEDTQREDQVDYSRPQRSEQKGARISGQNGTAQQGKKGGCGCSDNDFRFKGVEWTGPPMSRIDAMQPVVAC